MGTICMRSLLTTSSHKLDASHGKGYLPAALHLLPHTLAYDKEFNRTLGTIEPLRRKASLCPRSTPACRAHCLVHSGMGMAHRTLRARHERTRRFLDDRKAFLRDLERDIDRHARHAEERKLKPCVRLNATSDVNWFKTAPWLFWNFPHVQFYDYTKRPDMYQQWRETGMSMYSGGKPLWNVHLSFSWSGTRDNAQYCRNMIQRSFQCDNLPLQIVVPDVGKTYDDRVENVKLRLGVDLGYYTDGDEHDLRFLDDDPTIVVLKVKHTSSKFRSKEVDASPFFG